MAQVTQVVVFSAIECQIDGFIGFCMLICSTTTKESDLKV